jgi:hypothetical protein
VKEIGPRGTGEGWVGEEFSFEHQIDLVGIWILAAGLVIGIKVFPDVTQRSHIDTYATLLEALSLKGVRDGFSRVPTPSGKRMPVPLRVPVLDHWETAFAIDYGLSGVTYILHQDANSVDRLSSDPPSPPRPVLPCDGV